jgi:cobalt-zinc-cadmium efflux system membrane fusion protein
VEILSGLESGERYAATETFILKAELAKGEATHQH